MLHAYWLCENIAKGDPFGVYKDQDSFLMFLMIARNNLNVTALCFVSGILFSVGPLYVLFKNGLMLGAFEYLFISQGLGFQSHSAALSSSVLKKVWYHRIDR